MTMVADGALTPVVHANAMLLLPATMGFSTVLCLSRSPSPFTLVAGYEYLTRVRYFERGWLLVAFGWIGWAAAQGAAPVWTSALAVAALILTGLHYWLTGPLRTALASTADAVLNSGPVTTVNTDGLFVARRRTAEDIAAPAVGWAVRVFLLLLLTYVGLFVAGGLIAASISFGLAVLVAGLWLSVGVIGVDLVHDVWPGTLSQPRLATCFRYYVQVFEQWKNFGVLAGFGTVLIGAPIAFASGGAPAPVLAFPVWIAACLAFAIFFNQVLHRAGRVHSRLPLPVWVNDYSATRPLWAFFFTAIHTVMAVALLVGLAAVQPNLS